MFRCMKLKREKICSALDSIANTPSNTVVDLDKIAGLSDDEQNILFCILTFIGVVREQEGNLILSSESAALCIRSLSEFLRQGDVLIPVWENRAHDPAEINKHNAFMSANFLYLLECAREKAAKNREKLKPLKIDTIVRVAIVRRIWGKKYYLMQYDDRVGKYQLIGGRVLSGDATNEEALARKIREELPVIAGYITEGSTPQCIFKSQRTDEEIFLSDKFGVIAHYRSFIYEIRLKNVSKNLLFKISQNKANRWISIKEIEKEKARDGKAVFKLAPTAISMLRGMDPTIKIAQHDMEIFLEKTWVKVVLAFASVTGLIPILKWLLSLLPKLL